MRCTLTDYAEAELMLFRNVQNAPTLRRRILASEIDAALINAYLVMDSFQILVAMRAAAEKHYQNEMTTRNINTEVIYNLGAVRNIGKSLGIFGIQNECDYILAVVMHPTDEKVLSVRSAISGCEIDVIWTSLTENANIERICGVYGIEEKERAGSSLVDSIVTRMACRDIL